MHFLKDCMPAVKPFTTSKINLRMATELHNGESLCKSFERILLSTRSVSFYNGWLSFSTQREVL